MRTFAFFFSLLVTFTTVPLSTSAAFPVCTGAVCAGDPSGRDFCCPPSNQFDTFGGTAETSTCVSQPDCNVPAYVATWSQPWCSGTAQFQRIPVSQDSFARSACVSDSTLGSDYNKWRVACGSSASESWGFTQYMTQSDCDNNVASPMRARTYSSTGLDTACYNVAGGSVMVVCPLSGEVVSTSTTPSPSIHSAALAGSPSTQQFGQSSLGTFADSSCLAGSSGMTDASSTSCKTLYRYGTIATSYKITCVNNTSYSPWTASVWLASSCTGVPTTTANGQGRTCKSLATGSSMVVDCTRTIQGQYLNYLAPIDGAPGSWSTCSNSCGPGTATRTCSTPQHGGAPCSASTQLVQPCDTTSSCQQAADSSSSGLSPIDQQSSTGMSSSAASAPAVDLSSSSSGVQNQIGGSTAAGRLADNSGTATAPSTLLFACLAASLAFLV